jgi:hypothetical protein
MAVAERAQMAPGYDPIIIEKGILEAMDVPNSMEAFPLVQGEDGSMQLKFPPQPDPEFEIKRADMQRRTLEGQSRAEKDMLLAQSKVNVDQANIIKLMAEAAETADKPQLERLKLLDAEQEAIRKSLVEIAKIEESNRKADSGVDGKSDDD